MSDTNFIPQVTPIVNTWAQDVNDAVYRAIGTGGGGSAPATPADVLTNLGISGSGGAALVGYTQGSTGSVPRTAASKLQESCSVLDFGAVGDGVTDSTVAIQAAITYLETLPHGGCLIYPPGEYLVSSTLRITKSNIRQIGYGTQISLIVTTTDFNTMIISSGLTIESLINVDTLGIGFYHTNLVPRTSAHLTLISPQQSVFENSIGNGALGIVCYGGQGITFQRTFAPGNYDPGTNPALNSISAITLLAASTLAGYTMGASAVNLPTEVNFASPYINGPQLKGWQYGVRIFAGEHITFSGDYYVGQSTIHNIHIEQDANNQLILETTLEKGGYIDAAGSDAIWVGGPNGDGSQYIGPLTIDCNVKGQSGTGGTGIYIDGTPRAGAFTQAVRNLKLNANVSGFAGDGVVIEGAVNAQLGAELHVWGNSFLTPSSGLGLKIGPNVTGLVSAGGKIGGGSYGDGTGNQTFGVQIDPSATDIVLNGVDLTGNVAALSWMPNADVSRNRIVNCNGYNGARAAVALAFPASGATQINPFGAPASVLPYGGTITNITVNGQTMFSGATTVPIILGAADEINITYTGTPTWVWWPQ